MKSASRKAIILAVIVTALTLTGIFYLRDRTDVLDRSAFINPAFAEYISGYTTGVIPSGSTLRVVFASEIIDSTLIGQESQENVFKFSPSIKGKTVWVNTRSIEFRPEERLEAGQLYKAKFFLSTFISDLPGDLRTFEYEFKTIPQNYDVVIVNTKPYDQSNFQRTKIEAVINTADYADASNVEKAIDASQKGKNLRLTWTHEHDGRRHHFTIEDVKRADVPDQVAISVDGDRFGSKGSRTLEVEIPAVDDFKLLNAHVVQSPTQYVVLQFSDPLSESQDLEGLITIQDLQSLDFDIHENEIWIYPPVRQNGTKSITVSAGIRNSLSKKLGKTAAQEIAFEQVHPAVRFTGKGSILPGTNGLVVPFEAVNLNAVDIQIIRIYENNVLQFLQVNNVEGNNDLRRVGNRILRKKISLSQTGITDPAKWNRYTLDISELIKAEPGAIYEIRLGFRKEYSTYGCQTPMYDGDPVGQFDVSMDEIDDAFQNSYYFDYYDRDYYGDDYDWNQRDNPCHSSYYTSERSVSKNILASDLGLTVKRGDDGNTIVFVTDLRSTKPMSDVHVALYSFQLQKVGEAKTDSDGKAIISGKESPFAVVASNGQERGYLRLPHGEALSVSNFDVAGQVVHKGLKGFLYGERGVWRPGDSLFLTFVLEDKRKVLPKNHPVVFELANPQGQVMDRIVRASSENGFYKFATATGADAPTGNWKGRVKVGGTDFTQTLKIETVKPNRLKINLDFNTDKFTSSDISGELSVAWLHGAPGRNLKAEFEVMLSRETTQFQGFHDFNFDDPSREFVSETQTIFEGNTDAEGKAIISTTLESSGTPSGRLNAVFRGKVYEDGGNFSIDRFSVPFYPYNTFVGIRVPEGEQYSGVLHTGVDHKVTLATVDADGRPVSQKGIEINLYKLDWRWWWDNSNEGLANFLEGSYSKLEKSGKVNTSNGKGEWSFNVDAASYGRYFLRACDPVSGHCAGQIIYVDEPGWYSRARGDDARGGANLLAFSTDKTQYSIGEKVRVTIPGVTDGRALVSVEDGSKVLQTHWMETKKGENVFSFDAEAGMAPNVYIHVSLLQPHDQTENDLPIRLYGVTAVKVEDPASHLEPLINIPEVLVPGERVSIRVSEKNNRRMTFTVAMVDEGLLDLTRFKTPDAWNTFYAREALGVRTWDIFDDVIGAYGANLERFISIGGDDALSPGEVDPLANRFRPVVRFFGPVTIDRGQKEIHFTMPQYIGSVRTMVVAGYEGAYGSTEKVSKVKKPLMVLATLPRVLGPDEAVSLPVTLFAEKSVTSVRVDVAVKGALAVSGDHVQTIDLGRNSDTTIDFQLKVKPQTGVASVEVRAVSGNLKASDVIEIQIRNPNLPVTRVQEFLVEQNETVNTTLRPFGVAGSNTATLEISNMPPINLASRMRYLLQYPHGCVEQTTSAVFPQLYVGRIKALTEPEKKAIERNVSAGIEQLRRFAQADGGFAYWPGLESTDSWSTSYAGHFLIEAESSGYYVPVDMINRWKDFQRTRASAWRRTEDERSTDLIQAYRLYTLAVAGAPELGAMNRLREEPNLSPAAAWMLAAAYAGTGQKEVARTLARQLPLTIAPYREMAFTYGSQLRDKALILETLVLLDDRVRAFEVLREISEALGNDGYWMSTQETSMCLRAASLFVSGHQGGELKFDYRIANGETVMVSTGLPLANIQIPVLDLAEKTIRVSNKGEGPLFTRLITNGTPLRGTETDEASNLLIETHYTNKEGNTIDPSQMEQGTQFIAEVSVRHPGIRNAYRNLALSQVFPSGWEINNLRLTGDESFLRNSEFTYQDIRDDRVLTYFDLSPGEKRIFRVSLTASYAGIYYLPGSACEAMYDPGVYAREKGHEISVIKPVR